MKYKSLTLALLFLSVLSKNSYGQEDKYNYGHVTPQTADFMKYGDIPVSLFAGKMNIEIPIYRIKDRDFDIPIRLLYTADGFKPEKRSDFVGLDWTLIAGGCITREIYGAPDDFFATSMHNSKEHGFMWVIQDVEYQNRDEMWNLSSPKIVCHESEKLCEIENKNGCFQEYQPDLFMFNFNGHTGQFMINNKGKGQANHPGYKIDLSGLTPQYDWYLEAPEVSTLRITTPDGYRYEFGNDLDAMEYSISYQDGDEPVSGETYPTILAWHLSKITAPNGRTVTFNYVKAGNLFDKSNPIWQAGRGTRTTSALRPISASATKKAVLESIEVDGVKVEFKKSKETIENGNFFLGQLYYNSPTYQLDSVIVKHNDEKVYTYTLGYENVSKRRFLSSLFYPDGGMYLFEYKHASYPTDMDPLPSGWFQGEERDDYGYWKKNNNESSFGLMSKITYPTKGYSLFTYEKHHYTCALELNLRTLTKDLVISYNADTTITNVGGGGGDTIKSYDDSEYIILPPPKKPIVTTTYKMHGARIKTIAGYSAESVLATKKEYIYANAITNGTSSGILYQSDPYVMINNNKKDYISKNNLWSNNYSIEESPVGYSYVIEKWNDGSSIHYKFSDYNTHPDYNNLHPYYNTGNVNFEVVYSECFSNDLLKKSADLIRFNINRVSGNSGSRGMLIEKLVRDINNIDKSRELNCYRGINDVNFIIPMDEEIPIDDSYIVSFRGLFGGKLSRKVYLRAYPQVKQTIWTDNVGSEELFRYNSYDQLSSKTVIFNQTDTLRTNYTYPTECSEGYCSTLTTQHRLSPVIEQMTYRRNNNGSPIEIERVRTSYMFAPLSGNNLMVPDMIQSTRSGSNQWRSDMIFNRYDEYGNVLQQTAIDGTPISYLWSYNHQYPIAEIRNATYEQVKNLIQNNAQKDVEDIASSSTFDSLEQGAVNQLRTLLPNAQITTYTYKPLVGMLSVTDPSGKTVYYEYDDHHRLKCIKDLSGKIIESYDYHYRNQ